MDRCILVINCGSSSLKMAIFSSKCEFIASAIAERLGQPGASASVKGRRTEVTLPQNATHADALSALIECFHENNTITDDVLAIGHRVVHGGETFSQPALIDDTVIESIRACENLAPLHNPVGLAGIEATRSLFPDVPQIAVFDTAFHQSLPPVAYLYALPRYLYTEHGVRRYGFHGTSHRFMLTEAARILQKHEADTSIISAHLGNGCSVTAIRNGKSVDTSMGLTPLEGLVMGTRSGDVDPGLFDYLRRKGFSAETVHNILNQESGLLGLSGTTNDMRTLIEQADDGSEAAQQALDVFCFRLARYIGAMMASLEQLDALVFTGGIGENSERVRARTLDHLLLLGFKIDTPANRVHGDASGGHIEATASRFPILVIPTNEELVIAQAALKGAKNVHD